MKAIYLHAAGAIALSFAIAACVPQAEPPAPTPPPVVQAPAPTPTPTPTPVPVVQEPVFENYLDAPQTAGDWTYRDQSNGGMALYSAADGSPLFMLECDRVVPSIMLFRASGGEGTRAARIQTETTERALQMQGVGSGHVVQIDPRDPILDAMAITKGRFAVGVEGERTLYLPAWVEVSRVIEDCR